MDKITKASAEAQKVTIGIDLGSGTDKSAVSLARMEDDGTIHIIACDLVSNELASFVQGQDERCRTLEKEHAAMRELLQNITIRRLAQHFPDIGERLEEVLSSLTLCSTPAQTRPTLNQLSTTSEDSSPNYAQSASERKQSI